VLLFILTDFWSEVCGSREIPQHNVPSSGLKRSASKTSYILGISEQIINSYDTYNVLRSNQTGMSSNVCLYTSLWSDCHVNGLPVESAVKKIIMKWKVL